MKILDGKKLKSMLISASNNLYNHYPEVDALNVFPIPDGDTGINMNLTLCSGLKEIQYRTDNDCYVIAKAFASGLFDGTRGNSGAITSQIFAGFAKGILNKSTLTVFDLSDAFIEAKKTAYKAVLKPVEGTILTVIREAGEKLASVVNENMSIEQAFDVLVKEANESLKRTPNLLPVLKEVGVVDSGGAGLCIVLEGMQSALLGKPIERKDETNLTSSNGEAQVLADAENTEFGYCTEFILKLGTVEEGKRIFNINRFKSFLNSHGNSLVVIQNDDLIKVHVHTLKPGVVFNYAQNFGEFKKMKCENMTEQHHEILLNEQEKSEDEKSAAGKINHGSLEMPNKEEKKKEFALIATSSGKGVDEYFHEAGVDYIVSGGQTMNPSTGDFINVIKKSNAEHIYIFPNNSNIILSANQARDALIDEYDVTIIETKTIPQGISSALNFNPALSKEDNIEAMNEAISQVKSGAVTYAIKDSVIDGLKIKQNDYLAIKETKDIIGSYRSKIDAFKTVVNSLVDEDSSVITVLYGKDVTNKEKEQVEKYLNKTFKDLDFDLRDGEQPVYSFLIGVE